MRPDRSDAEGSRSPDSFNSHPHFFFRKDYQDDSAQVFNEAQLRTLVPALTIFHCVEVSRSFLKMRKLFEGLVAYSTIAVILSPFFNPERAASEPALRVLKGSYLVDPAPNASPGNQTGALLSIEGFHAERIGKGAARGIFRLQRRTIPALSAASVSAAQEFIPFDENDPTCRELIAGGIALSCSPDFEVHASRDSNDTLPWGIEDIGAPIAWNKTTGSKDVVVAVLDTGVDYTHPDLAPNMWTNPGEIPGNGIDDDGNGIIDDVHGMNALDDSGDPMDDNGHGTHVAGTIGAVGNNGKGVVGVNWDVQIMALKFLSASGSGSLSGAIKATNYLLDLKARGVNVRAINNSWGGGGFSQQLYDIFRKAGDNGVLLAIAAGNESNDNDTIPSYPASFDLSNIISVAAIDREHNLASYSNYGAVSVDIAAPGVSILSLAPNNGRATMSGTSMATPHVAGAAALLLSVEPSLTPEQVAERLYESGTPSAGLSGLIRSGRILNIGRAIMGENTPLLTEPAQDPCAYTVARVSFNPDRSADGSRAVLTGDEMEFRKVPFDFEYFGQNAREIVLSLNGLVYVGKTPQDMDYRNGSKAPADSIAALHTDLDAPGPPFGVRYHMTNDGEKLVVSWLMRHSSSPDSGTARAWLEINRTGEIKSCISIDPSILPAVSASSTLGISPNSTAKGITYLYNNAGMEADMCIMYTPQCKGSAPAIPGNGGGNVNVRKVKVVPRGGAGTLSPGGRMLISAAGTGSGTVSVATALNGRLCAGSTQMRVTNGRGKVTGRIPASLSYRRATKMTVRIGGRKVSKYVYGRTLSRSDNFGNNKLSNKAFSRLCDSLLKSLR